MLGLFKKKSVEGQIVKDIDVAEAKELLKTKKINILDVRTDNEYENEGRIEGAVLIDYFKVTTFGKELEKLDKTKPWLVYCAVGGRSKMAVNKMAKLGFVELYNLKGGIKAYLK